ncbi:membrane protein [Spirochaetia bacterium]|nr:membrane protein [Spirochaetia bacterium]
MHTLMTVLAGAASLYMILIFIRIMLTWFSGADHGRPAELLCNITDPYLKWFRRFSILRVAALDLSPIVALAILSVVNNIFMTLARHGSITVGSILGLLLSVVWSAASFLLGFFLIILVLRLIAYLTRRNVYGSFWRIIDTLARPILFRINRIIFGQRLVRYQTGLFASIGALIALRVGLGFLVHIGTGFLTRLPV